MTNEQAIKLIEALYRAVDSKDLNYLNTALTDDVNFRIGNNNTITDKATALDANKQFFECIGSMRHTIDKVWAVGNDIICNGMVNYIRLDGSEHSAYFSTVLTMKGEKIADYFVYADLSGL
ncbi:MAG: nuclear transport factor 2 family protein [Colwellia sp.]|nr:nuclear transport factor 2 family protein [Colwellia sp.]